MIKADLVDSFSMYIKNGKARIGFNQPLVMIISQRKVMETVISVLKKKMELTGKDAF